MIGDDIGLAKDGSRDDDGREGVREGGVAGNASVPCARRKLAGSLADAACPDCVLAANPVSSVSPSAGASLRPCGISPRPMLTARACRSCMETWHFLSFAGCSRTLPSVRPRRPLHFRDGVGELFALTVVADESAWPSVEEAAVE